MTHALAIVLCLTFITACGGPRQSDSSQRRALASEQASTRHDLARTQREERAALSRAQQVRREEELAQARAELSEQTEEARTQREEADRESDELSTMIERACSAVAEEQRDTCPIEPSKVDSVRNVTRGIAVRLDSRRADFQSRLDCYRARAAVRVTAPVASVCLLDIGEVDVNVGETGGRAEVQLTSDAPGSVTELRTRARDLR